MLFARNILTHGPENSHIDGSNENSYYLTLDFTKFYPLILII